MIMPLLYKLFHDAVCLELARARRAAMFAPAAIYLILAVRVKTCSQDTPTGRFDVSQLGKTSKAGFCHVR